MPESSNIAATINKRVAAITPLETSFKQKLAAFQRDQNPSHLVAAVAIQQQIIAHKSAALDSAVGLGSVFEGIVKGLHPSTPGPKVSLATQSAIEGLVSNAIAGAPSGNFGTTPGLSGGGMTEKMSDMNMQFLALQEATQMESRKFQTLSNASQARHDIALNAIRNMGA